MRQDQASNIAIVVASVLFIVAVTIATNLYVDRVVTERYQKQAIAVGCGRFNPETAKFEWIPTRGGTR